MSEEKNKSSKEKKLAGQVALVTGASRGIGRGIALQLGEAGATVYVTGRKPKPKEAANDANYAGEPKKESNWPTLQETADEITSRGGIGIAVYCDHSNDDDIKSLFAQIEKEQNGRLDILVNNAYSASTEDKNETTQKFWVQEPSIWDTVNHVGLRNHYICSVYAARLMVTRKSGMILFISSSGGLVYMFNVAYGVGKTAVDRMAADMAHELSGTGVSAISIWPGAVRTERAIEVLADLPDDEQNIGEIKTKIAKEMYDRGESVEFTGKAVVALAADKKVAAKSGKVVTSSDLAREYGFRDIDGRSPDNMRSVKYLLQVSDRGNLASVVPSFVRLPGWMIKAATSNI